MSVLSRDLVPSTPNANKRTRNQVEADYALIAELAASGHTYQQITEEIARVRDYTLSISQVGTDMKEVRKRWAEQALGSMDELRGKLLAEIEQIFIECWNAWRESKKQKEKTYSEIVSDTRGDQKNAQGEPKEVIYARQKARKILETRDPDTKYMAVLQWCIEQKRSIYGLDAAQKVQLDWRTMAANDGADPSAVFNEMVKKHVEEKLKNLDNND